MNGRPLTINRIAAEADAILEGWYLGEATGKADVYKRQEEDGNFVCAIDDDFFNFNVVSHVFSRLNGVEKEYAKQKMTLHPLQIRCV